MHPVYRGVPRQTGAGLGSMFRSLFRTIMPLVAPVAARALNTLKTEGPKHGFAAISRVMAGEGPKQVLKTQGLEFGKKLLDSIKGGFSATSPHSSSGAHSHQTNQTGKGLRRWRKRNTLKKLKRLHKRRQHKARSIDIFD